MSAERIVETTLSAKTKDQTVKEEINHNMTICVSLAWLVADTSAVGLDDPVADAGVTGGDPCA